MLNNKYYKAMNHLKYNIRKQIQLMKKATKAKKILKIISQSVIDVLLLTKSLETIWEKDDIGENVNTYLKFR